MATVLTIYTSDFCGYCKRAKSLLQAKGVAFEEINISEHPEKRAWLEAQTGERTVPQIFINDRPLGGWRELVELDASGQLDQLLSNHK